MANIKTISYDAIVIGGGGSGMRAALQLTESGLNTACITKVFPTRSHTVSAQGGITCAIASADPNDDWRWHMYDTVKGSDYIGDQDAIEYMCSVGPQAVFELEHMGLPFSRTEQGRIYQRPFGGQSKGPDDPTQAARTCAAADRTGHALLHTLYQANLKGGTTFLNEWYAVDLVKNSKNQVVGVVAIEIETGDVAYIKSKATVLATGGAGRIYASTTNALINTGDGVGMALRAGFPMQDMEIQYGAMLTVREGQAALFVNEGQIADTFGPGLHKLETQNIPVLTNLMHWDKAFQSPFKSDVYFFATRLQTAQRWGTAQPVVVRDREFGAVRLRGGRRFRWRPSSFITSITNPQIN